MSYPMDLDEYDEERLVHEIVARRIARDAGLCDYCHRPRSESSCRMTARHAGEVPDLPLLISDVSRVSRARARRWHPGFPDAVGGWTGADWSNAMCGEAGETANVVKKLRRAETGADPGPNDGTRTELLAELAHEIADVYLYLDLLAAHYGVVSVRQGFPERLGSGVR